MYDINNKNYYSLARCFMACLEQATTASGVLFASARHFVLRKCSESSKFKIFDHPDDVIIR